MWLILGIKCDVLITIRLRSGGQSTHTYYYMKGQEVTNFEEVHQLPPFQTWCYGHSIIQFNDTRLNIAPGSVIKTAYNQEHKECTSECTVIRVIIQKGEREWNWDRYHLLKK